MLTTDLAGMEFPLDKASLVIGRTDENDVLLNHRSISRHHAKIVRDGDHYTIVDLQSANGVRVNGEDYERIELNAGDVVELGHVKMRFVGPLEELRVRPARAAAAALPVKAIAIGGGALAVIGLAALFLHRVELERAARRARPRRRRRRRSRRPPAGCRAATPPPAPAAPPPPETPAAILAAAKQAVVAEDWETRAGRLGRIAGADDPAIRREATALGRRVETERQGAPMFAKFDEAANAKNYAAALSRLRSRSRPTAFTRGAPSRATRRRARC